MSFKDKIIQIRKQKKLKITDIHKKLVQIFGENAISYRTLLRIEQGDTDGRDASLYQICLALGITLQDLKSKNVDANKNPISLTKRDNRRGRFIYNEKTFAEILTPSHKNYQASELILKPKGKTKIEQDPLGKEIFIYVLSGKLTCVIENQKKFIVEKDDSISFLSTMPHYYENTSSQKTRCLIIHICTQ